MRSDCSITTVAILGAALVCSLLLAAPAETVSTRYVNDLLVFLDGGYRITQGQVPNRDYHTALGPVSFYIPAIGYWLTGRAGAVMPVGMVFVLLVMAGPMVHILRTRMRPAIAIPTGVLLILIVASPNNTGEAMTDLSFAMFYNRIGWAAIGLLLLMHLRPYEPQKWQTALDAASATVLALLMLFTKASFGLVALAFLLLTLIQPVQRRWAALSLLIILVGAGLIELVWRGGMQHFADLALAADVSGSRSLMTYLRILLDNRGEFLVFAFVVLLALWRTRSVPDFLFYGFCAATGLMLISQNFQIRGVVTLLAGAAVAAETLMRHPRLKPAGSPDRIAAAAPLMLAVILLPLTFTSASALGLHTALALAKSGEAFDLPHSQGLRLVRLANEGDFRFMRTYLASLREGAEVLSSLDDPPRQVFVLDFASPFASMMRIPAPSGDSAWMHSGRNFNADHHPLAEEMFANVDIVMQPLEPVSRGTSELLVEIYDDYLKQNYDQVRTTAKWRVLRRTSSTAGGREEDDGFAG